MHPFQRSKNPSRVNLFGEIFSQKHISTKGIQIAVGTVAFEVCVEMNWGNERVDCEAPEQKAWSRMGIANEARDFVCCQLSKKNQTTQKRKTTDPKQKQRKAIAPLRQALGELVGWLRWNQSYD